ncbi:hypothetical protein PMAYCL1PPCAC_18059, partial [Pristionchus mayeri]
AYIESDGSLESALIFEYSRGGQSPWEVRDVVPIGQCPHGDCWEIAARADDGRDVPIQNLFDGVARSISLDAIVEVEDESGIHIGKEILISDSISGYECSCCRRS